MGPFGIMRVYTGPYRTKGEHMGPYRTHIGLYGTMWNHTKPKRTIRDYTGSYGTNCIAQGIKYPFRDISLKISNTSIICAKIPRQAWAFGSKMPHSCFARRGPLLGNQHQAKAFSDLNTTNKKMCMNEGKGISELSI